MYKGKTICKNKYIFVIFAMLMVLMFLTSCDDKNSNGKNVEYKKIIATSVATCEILDKLEVDNVIGVPQSDSYKVPERYKDAEIVGGAMSPNIEIISSLNPDIILSPNSLKATLEVQYENIGKKSYFLDLTSVEGMYKSIDELGNLLGKKKEANTLIENYKKEMENINENIKDKEKPKVLVLMGLPGSYVVATENSYVGNLVKLAGGINVYGDGNGKEFLNVNSEDMLLKEPDIILRTSHAMPTQVMEMFKKEFEENDIWKHFEAVKNKKVYDLDNQYFGMSATFRYSEALKILSDIMYN